MALLTKLDNLPVRMEGPPEAVCAWIAACDVAGELPSTPAGQVGAMKAALVGAVRPALEVFGRAGLILAVCALAVVVPVGFAALLDWKPEVMALFGALTALGCFVYGHDRADLFPSLDELLGAPYACVTRALGAEPRAEQTRRLLLAHALAHVVPVGAFERVALVQNATTLGVILTRPGAQLAIAATVRDHTPMLAWQARTDDPLLRDAWRVREVARAASEDGLSVSEEAPAPLGTASLDALIKRLAHVAAPPGAGGSARPAWSRDLARLSAADAPLALLSRATREPPLAPRLAPLRRGAWARFGFFWSAQAVVVLGLGLGVTAALWRFEAAARDIASRHPIFTALVALYGLMLGVAFCAEVARRTPRLPSRIAPWQPPERAAATPLHASAERFGVEGEGFDLSRPFTLRASRDPVVHEDVCLVTLELRQPAERGEPAPRVLAFAVPLATHPRLVALPELITSAPCLPTVPFVAQAWPALRDACAMHGVGGVAPLMQALEYAEAAAPSAHTHRQRST